MGIALSSITGQTTEASIDFAGLTITFSYRPHAITLGRSIVLSEGGEDMLEVLVDVIDSWDIYDEEPDDLPVSVENLKKLPVELATLIAQRITRGATDEVAEQGKD